MHARPHSAVVLLPGLCLPGLAMGLLQWRLHQIGYPVYRFGYSAVYSPVANTVRRLHELVDGVRAKTVHFIGFSLGGLLLYHYFQGQPMVGTGSVILLGSPIRGSKNVQRAAAMRSGRALLGYSLEYGLLGNLPQWPPEQSLVMIAGSRGFGVGQYLLGDLAKPNDGTVAVQETRSGEVSRHFELPVSHSGLLFSKRVCNRIVQELPLPNSGPEVKNTDNT